MTWSAIPPDKAVQLVQFWVDAPWPMSEAQVVAHSQQLGWTVDEEGFLDNHTDGLNATDVMVSETKGEVGFVGFSLTDVERESSPQWEEFRHDRYTEYARALEGIFGTPVKTRRGKEPDSLWDVDNGVGIVLATLPKSIKANIYGPTYANTLRRLGEWGA